MSNNVCVIVPAYNEEQSIVGVIMSLREYNPGWHIVVVNDASTDSTEELAINAGADTVLSLRCNLGIGGCVETGFKFAASNDFDVAVQFDGDGQHVASEIPKLIQPVLDERADVVIGSRFIKNQESGFRSVRLRRVGIRVFEILNSILIQQRITDNTSGFRAYGRRAFSMLSRNYPVDYPEPEAVILLGKNGFRIREVPVQMKHRDNGASSIGGLTAAYYMVKVVVSVLIASTRPKLES